MSPPVSAVTSNDNQLPARADVVVIGAGIAGICTAWELAKRGKRVIVVEKGIVAGEQSSRNWGWCRQQNRDPRELPLMKLSLDIWPQLNEEIGEDTGFRRTGLLFATSQQAELDVWQRWANFARNHGFEPHALSALEVAERLPGTSRSWIGGFWSPNDGRAEPSLAVPAIARDAQRRGAIIAQNCAVREIDFANNRATGVVTERGRIACDAVLVAGGAWTGTLLRHHGLKFLQASVKSTSFFTTELPLVTEGGTTFGDIAIRRRLDGGYTVGLLGRGQLQVTPWGILQTRAFWETFKIRRAGLTYAIGRSFFNGPEAFARWDAGTVSPFENIRVLDPAADAHLVKRGIDRFEAIYPALAGKVRPVQSWGGMVDTTPDAMPVISGVAARPGLFISSGYSGHGFGTGPGAGRLAADLICGDEPCIDPTPFRYERMIDGTDLGRPGLL